MQPEESHEPPCAKKQSRPTTILAVEDDEANRELIVLLISTLPAYHYCLVSNAYQALYVTKEDKPDLFLVDYRLPGMNGLKLYDQLHATPGLEAIPALLLTATRLEELRPEIEQRQITVLEKPFDLDAFFLTVQRLLGQSPGEQRAEEDRT
jgi:CheY-like chemotaxis protein